MAPQIEPEIVLYDLACTQGVCFSPSVWRIRIMLNYKHVSYRTVFLEFPDVGPTLKSLGLTPHDKGSPGYHVDYTVPAMHHIPTNTYMIDSVLIAAFLEKIYPEPQVPLRSELGREVQEKLRREFFKIHNRSLRPREIYTLSPRSQEYFRRKTEPSLGHPIEDLLVEPSDEEANWKAVHENLVRIDELLNRNAADGPFILGAQPSLADFFLAGSLQFAKMVSEDVFQRMNDYPAFKRIYEACLPRMEQDD